MAKLRTTRLTLLALATVLGCGDDGGAGAETESDSTTGSTTAPGTDTSTSTSSGSSGSTSSADDTTTTAAGSSSSTGSADSESSSSGTTGGEIGPAELFPTSLHATRHGKEYFYTGTKDDPGFYALTNVAYDDLECAGCHAPTYADGSPVDPETYEPSCADCHEDPDAPTADIADTVCLGCHGRQQTEINLAAGGMAHMNDVHRDAGMRCVDCHGAAEMHGDGTEYVSQLEPGAPRATCESCHPAPPNNMSHNIHDQTLDCASCHTQSVVACNNCHFETEVQGFGKRHTGPLTGFTMLVNREATGKVHPATYQSLTYDGQAFMVVAPYYPHTVGPQARTCAECHDAAALTQYEATGSIDFVTWQEVSSTLLGPSGVIPVPPDWSTALQVDFLDYTAADLSAPTDPDAWAYQQSGMDLTQMLFATPLSDDQLQSLADGG